MNGITIGAMQMFSPTLESTVPYTILLPDAALGLGPYPVLLQLHGYYDNHTAWLYKSNLLLHIEQLPLIVVLPSGGNYFWCDYNARAKMETFLMQDLWNHIHQMFSVHQDARWAIGGLSMGGFGALRLGLKYPDKFCSIFAHSSVVPTTGETFRGDPEGVPEITANLDCLHLAEQLSATTVPRLSFDCGVEDGLIAHNRRFHQHLDKLNLPHQYMEHPGGHTWDYWDKHVQTALRQHMEVLQTEMAQH